MDIETKNDELDENEDELEDAPEENGENDENDEGDAEFELDEDGNIIIPDDEEAKETDDSDDDDDSDDSDKEEDEEKQPEEKGKEEPDLAGENAELKSRLENNAKRIKAALKKLGIDTEADDVIDGIETLAAEADGKTLEEYRKERRDTEEAEEAKAFLKKQAFENLKKADLAELHATYPETAELDDVEKMENFRRFAELRDKGLSAKEAYAAANPEAMRKSAAERGKRLAGTKAHIKSAAPKGVAGESTDMPPREIARWREMFPGYTDKQIKELFKRANS